MSDQITPILMPKWGLTMKQGKLVAWHVEEGTQIAPGDEIMDVETDKIANVVEAANSGLLRRIVSQEDQVYPVQALLAVMAPTDVSDAEVEAYIGAYEVPVADEDEEDAAPAHEYAALPVGRIRYARRPGEGTPVVLVHGFGGDLDNWLFNIDALSADRPVYALDLPGHGQSAKDVEAPDLDLMVSTLIAFMDENEIETAHLVGHSMGGLISGQAALAHPDRVASLSLISSAGLGPDINGEYISGFTRAASRKEMKPQLMHLFHDADLVSRAMVNDLLKYKRLDGVQIFLESLSRAMFEDGRQAHEIATGLSSSEVPTLVIWGEADAILPAAHAEALPGAKVHVIADAGHMVQMEQAGTVNDLLKAHFQ